MYVVIAVENNLQEQPTNHQPSIEIHPLWCNESPSPDIR